MNLTEIFILIILIIVLVGLAFLIFKPRKEPQQISVDNLKDAINRIETDLKNNFGNLTNEQKTNIAKWTEALNKIGNNDTNIVDLKRGLEKLTSETGESQKQNIEKLTATLEHIITSQTTIEGLKNNIVNLNTVFLSQKQRGSMGEFTLELILSNILGEDKTVWTKQAELYVEKNKSDLGRVDALIHTGESGENIAIDAKFPLDKYVEMEKAIREGLDQNTIEKLKNDFNKAVNDNIKQIKKYFDPRNQISSAILFVPSEAIFAFLVEESHEMFLKAIADKIWICSPTTLAAVAHVILQAQRDYKLNKNLIEVKELIISINKEYERFNDRWEAVKKKIIDNQSEMKNLDITIQKIQKNQNKLEKFDLDE